MIAWSGLGFLVAVIVVGISWSAEVISERLTGNDIYYQEKTMPFAIALFSASVIIYVLGRWLNTQNAKVYIDKESGEEMRLRKKHSFFFIPMEYWGILTFVFTIFEVIKRQI